MALRSEERADMAYDVVLLFRIQLRVHGKGEDLMCRAKCLGHIACPAGIGIFGVDTPVAGEEGSKTGGVRQNVEEVVPTNVLTAGFGDRNVNQVTSPGDGAEAEEDSEVVVQTRFSVFEPGQGRTELGLQVQPAGEEGPSRQDHHEDGTLIQLGIRLHADCVEPVIKA